MEVTTASTRRRRSPPVAAAADVGMGKDPAVAVVTFAVGLFNPKRVAVDDVGDDGVARAAWPRMPGHPYRNSKATYC